MRSNRTDDVMGRRTLNIYIKYILFRSRTAGTLWFRYGNAATVRTECGSGFREMGSTNTGTRLSAGFAESSPGFSFVTFLVTVGRRSSDMVGQVWALEGVRKMVGSKVDGPGVGWAALYACAAGVTGILLNLSGRRS